MNNLSRERINQLLAAANATPKEDPTLTEAQEFNWFEPHCFNKGQLENINKFTQKLAGAFSEKFSEFNNCKYDVLIASTTQYFTGEYLKDQQNNESQTYYLPFTVENEHPCGFIGIPEQTAFVWATQLLGDSKSEDDSKRELSQLEESLLCDLVRALVDPFSQTFNLLNFVPAGSFTKEFWPLEAQPNLEICKIDFDVKKNDSESGLGAYIIILCSKLEAIAGKSGQIQEQLSPAEASKAVAEHLKEMKLNITADLARPVLTFEEIMNLQVDDILLLGRGINEPAELMLGNLTVHRGWPSKSDGQYALVITGN